jgi:hypothetical protein
MSFGSALPENIKGKWQWQTRYLIKIRQQLQPQKVL